MRYEKLEEAITEIARETGNISGDEFINSYIIVCHIGSLELVEQKLSGYFVIVPQGFMSQHEAVGLLEIGRNHIYDVTEIEGDD